MKLRSDDRVLLLALPSTEELAAMARILMHGVVVGLGDVAEVDAARKSLAEFDNVMFVEALPDHIPWRDAYFTKVIMPPHLESSLRSAAAELHRVLAPGGEIVRETADA